VLEAPPLLLLPELHAEALGAQAGVQVQQRLQQAGVLLQEGMKDLVRDLLWQPRHQLSQLLKRSWGMELVQYGGHHALELVVREEVTVVVVEQKKQIVGQPVYRKHTDTADEPQAMTSEGRKR
jgi:hypothetical protein